MSFVHVHSIVDCLIIAVSCVRDACVCVVSVYVPTSTPNSFFLYFLILLAQPVLNNSFILTCSRCTVTHKYSLKNEERLSGAPSQLTPTCFNSSNITPHICII